MEKSQQQGNLSLLNQDLVFACEIFCNNHLSRNYTERWIHSGLFYLNIPDQTIRPICPLIDYALTKYLGNQDIMETIITVLSANPSFRGNAFE